MDFVFWSSIQDHPAPRIVISYDIACAWRIHLLTRRESLPSRLSSVDLTAILDFVIPKFHIMSHVKACHDKFSLNYRRGMARTDGENIERGWAWMNPASLSTREMGPGARRDTLDDQWNYWNWRILVQLGKCSSSQGAHQSNCLIRVFVSSPSGGRFPRVEAAASGSYGIHSNVLGRADRAVDEDAG